MKVGFYLGLDLKEEALKSLDKAIPHAFYEIVRIILEIGKIILLGALGRKKEIIS